MSPAFIKEIISIMKTIQITLDDRLHRRAKTLAFTTGRTFTDFVREAVHDHVARLERQPEGAFMEKKGRKP